MRSPIIRGLLDTNELVVDNFAGGGGASTGIEAAIGRPVDFAINHSPEALAMHARNHPETKHFCENIWEVDPRVACGSRPVGLAWFSPDCTHFSRAKGKTPLKREIRGLAWVVVRWARTVRPRVIVVENVEEFQTWGPLRGDGLPDKRHVGETFRQWLSALTELGYSIDWRTLVAADYGAPTTRKRLFLVARRDGANVVWPEPTHGQRASAPWRPAAEIIDWGLPCPSIFDRSRPLAEATMRRIAVGIKRYVIDAVQPFIVDGFVPTLIQTGYGERPGQTPRVPGLEKPLGTVVACGAKHALVAAFLTKHYGGVVGHGVERPLGTVTAKDHHSVTAALIVKNNHGQKPCSGCDDPLHTVTTQFNRFALVQAMMRSHGVGSPRVKIAGQQYVIADVGMRMLQPHELFAAQGFPPDYDITPEYNGKPLTKTVQIALAGNSVPPPLAEHTVLANLRGAA